MISIPWFFNLFLQRYVYIFNFLHLISRDHCIGVAVCEVGDGLGRLNFGDVAVPSRVRARLGNSVACHCYPPISSPLTTSLHSFLPACILFNTPF